MSRAVTLAGYLALAVAALAVEAAGRRSGRVATFGQALAAALGRGPVRVLVQVAWLWLGWHVFVRVDWR